MYSILKTLKLIFAKPDVVLSTNVRSYWKCLINGCYAMHDARLTRRRGMEPGGN